MRLIALFAVLATAALAQLRGVQTRNDVSVAAYLSCGANAPQFVLGDDPTCLMVSVKVAHPDAARVLVTVTFERDGEHGFDWRWIEYDGSWETVAIPFEDCKMLKVEVEVFDATGVALGWERFTP